MLTLNAPISRAARVTTLVAPVPAPPQTRFAQFMSALMRALGAVHA
jgi:hypothetical protein